MAVGHNFNWQQPGAGLKFQGVTNPAQAFDRWVIGGTQYNRPNIAPQGGHPSAANARAAQGGNILLDMMRQYNPNHSVLKQAVANGAKTAPLAPDVKAQVDWEKQYGHVNAKNVYQGLQQYAAKHNPGVPLTGDNLSRISPQYKASALDWYHRDQERRLSKDNNFLKSLPGMALTAAITGGIGAASPLAGALSGSLFGGMRGGPAGAITGALPTPSPKNLSGLFALGR